MCVYVYRHAHSVLGITFFDVIHNVQENDTWIDYPRDRAVAV